MVALILIRNRLGGFGFDFSSPAETDEEYKKGVDLVAHRLLSYGITTFAPTIITSPSELYRKVRVVHSNISQLLPLLQRRNGDANGAGILGMIAIQKYFKACTWKGRSSQKRRKERILNILFVKKYRRS